MIRKETNVTFEHCPDKVFERVTSDTYYVKEKSTGIIYAEAVNVTVDINDYEEVTTMPLPVTQEEI
jgi:hypothetical protein